jgi:hypothetical protein
MNHNNVNSPMTYESPDNGHTVYARVPGQSHRVIHARSEMSLDNLKMMQDDQLWHKIRLAGKIDPELQDLLDRACVYYYLHKSAT